MYACSAGREVGYYTGELVKIVGLENVGLAGNSVELCVGRLLGIGVSAEVILELFLVQILSI